MREEKLVLTGQIHFQDSSLSPLAGQFDLRILGQNVTYDGDPIREPVILAQETTKVRCIQHNIQSPIESEPGGMVFYVEAVNLLTVQHSLTLDTTVSNSSLMEILL